MAADSEVTKQFYYAVKSRSSCLICDNPNIQFHHIKPSEKVAEVCKVARVGDMGLLMAEFRKVVPVCDHDHRDIHAGKIKGWLFGKTIHGAPSSGQVAERRQHIFLNNVVYRDPVDVLTSSIESSMSHRTINASASPFV